MDALIAPLLCPKCKRNILAVKNYNALCRGCGQKVEVVCLRCTYGHVDYCSPLINTTDQQSRKPFDINHRAVLAAREVGLSQGEMIRMLSMLNIKGGLHHHRQILSKLLHGTSHLICWCMFRHRPIEWTCSRLCGTMCKYCAECPLVGDKLMGEEGEVWPIVSYVSVTTLGPAGPWRRKVPKRYGNNPRKLADSAKLAWWVMVMQQ